MRVKKNGRREQEEREMKRKKYKEKMINGRFRKKKS